MTATTDKHGRVVHVGDYVWLETFMPVLRQDGVTWIIGKIASIDFEYHNQLFIDIGCGFKLKTRSGHVVEFVEDGEALFAIQEEEHAPYAMLSCLESIS